MDKQQIIDYVMNNPANTNPNVLGTMLDSMDGMVNMVTIFDDDITCTYHAGSQYGPAYGDEFEDFTTAIDESGIIRVTYENKSALGVYTNTNFEATVSIEESPLYSIRIAKYSSPNSFYFRTTALNQEVESEFEAYCQEPHHLKIEWFTI